MPRGRRSNLRRRKPARKARKARKLRIPKIADKGQTCRVIETLELDDLNTNQSTLHFFALSQFPRAANIATNFKYYRAARVIWSHDPLYNTFQDGVNAASKPYMYTAMNRTQLAQSGLNMSSLAQFQCAGARPVTFVGQKKISYKPNWCSPGLLQIRTNANGSQDFVQSGLQCQYGWLATQNVLTSANLVKADGVAPDSGDRPVGVNNITPGSGLTNYVPQYVLNNNVVYNGHITYIDQKYTGGETSVDPVARLTCTVVWEFKGAQNPLLMTNP